MATVQDTIRTWRLNPPAAGERLRVLFIPSSAGTSANGIFPKRTEYVYPDANGSISVNLAPTTSIIPDAWYEIRFEWLRKDPDGNWQIEGWSDLDGKLRVPPAGGTISGLISDVSVGGPPIYFGHGLPPSWLPPGGVFYNLLSIEGSDIYSDGVVIE